MKRPKKSFDLKQGDFLDGFSRPREAMARGTDPPTSLAAPVAGSVESQRLIAWETFDRYDRPEGLHSEEGLDFAVQDHPGINLEFFHKRQPELWKDYVIRIIYPVHDKYGIPVKRPTSHKRDAMVFRITPEGRKALVHLHKTGEWPLRDRKVGNNGQHSGVEVELEL